MFHERWRGKIDGYPELEEARFPSSPCWFAISDADTACRCASRGWISDLQLNFFEQVVGVAYTGIRVFVRRNGPLPSDLEPILPSHLFAFLEYEGMEYERQGVYYKLERSGLSEVEGEAVTKKSLQEKLAAR